VEKLKERLELARKKWDDMGLLSMTPKWHMLLAHAIEELLMRTGGGLIVVMGEDRIERAQHQLRERDRQRYSQSLAEHQEVDEGPSQAKLNSKILEWILQSSQFFKQT
jgi:thymidylate kinase